MTALIDEAVRAAIQEEIAPLIARIVALENSQTTPEVPPAEPPEDPPVEEPEEPPAEEPKEPPTEPETPVGEWNFHAMRQEFNAADLVILKRVWPVVSYYREERRIVASGRTSLEFQHTRGLGLTEGTYLLQLCRMTLDGPGPWFTVAEKNPEGATLGLFDFDVSGIENGVYWSQVVRPSGGVSPQYPIYVDNGGWFEQDFVPVATAQYDARSGVAVSAIMPTEFNPRVTPRRARKNKGPLVEGKTFVDQLVARRVNGCYAPNIDAAGRMGSETKHYYHLVQIATKYPNTPIFDGGYGKAFLPSPTQMQWSHAGGLWWVDPWGLRMITAEGKVTTLAGWRHAGRAAAHWDRDNPILLPELVGDWSEIEAAGLPVGTHEAWGLYILPQSVRVVDGMHTRNIVIYIADTQNDRVLKCEFQKDKMPGEVPCKVTVFIPNLKDPWQIVEGADESEIIVGQRHSNRLSVFDAETGVFKRHLVDCSDQMDLMYMTKGDTGARFASQGIFHSPKRPSIDQLRSHALIWPEGLANWTDEKGVKWTYVASAAMRQILRFNRLTGERQVVIPDIGHNGFFNITICQDDSVYPNGTILVSAWMNSIGGQPSPYSQDGQKMPQRFVAYNPRPGGRGRVFPDNGYASAACVGNEKIGQWGIAFAGSYGGVTRISPEQDDDPVIDPIAVERGGNEIHKLGLKTLYGQDFNSLMHSLPLPWGKSPDIDAYMAACGHEPRAAA